MSSDTSDRLPTRSFPLWPVLACAGLGLFDATQSVLTMHSQGMHHAWGRLFLMLLLTWLPIAAFAALLLRLGRRFPPTRGLSEFAIHLAIYLVLCLLTSLWSAALQSALNPYRPDFTSPPFYRLWPTKFENSLLGVLVLYTSILAAGYAITSHEKTSRLQAEAARLNEQLARTELDALKRQLEPHFLFNTLHAIAGLVRDNRQHEAINMIARLSDLLRRVVQNSPRQDVPLAEEMEFVENYLSIQKARFADRLQVRVEVPTELGRARVPCFLLQPLVENAIHHGIARRVKGGEVCIAATRVEDTLRVCVSNDGPELPGDGAHSGTGIANLRARLHTLYQSQGELQMRNQSDGVEVCVSIPYVSSGPGENG